MAMSPKEASNTPSNPSLRKFWSNSNPNASGLRLSDRSESWSDKSSGEIFNSLSSKASERLPKLLSKPRETPLYESLAKSVPSCIVSNSFKSKEIPLLRSKPAAILGISMLNPCGINDTSKAFASSTPISSGLRSNEKSFMLKDSFPALISNNSTVPSYSFKLAGVIAKPTKFGKENCTFCQLAL